jgi:hypothetical protein
VPIATVNSDILDLMIEVPTGKKWVCVRRRGALGPVERRGYFRSFHCDELPLFLLLLRSVLVPVVLCFCRFFQDRTKQKCEVSSEQAFLDGAREKDIFC